MLHRHGASIGQSGQDGSGRTCRHHGRRADEHGMQGVLADPGYHQVGLEALHLTAERVAAHHHVDYAQGPRPVIGQPSCQQHHARARSPRRHAAGQSCEQRLSQPVPVEQQRHGGALPAGDDQPVNILQLVWQAHQPGFRSQGGQCRLMFGDVTLERQDPDQHAGGGYQPRTASCSVAGISCTSRPGMAAPRPRDTSATMAASW